jgi:hypothetical protein
VPHKQPQSSRVLSITKARAVVPQRVRTASGPRTPQPADQPLPASLRRPTSRLLAHLKQLPCLASHLSRKPKQIVQLPRPISAAPVDLFSVANPQKSFKLRQGVFKKIRRVLGVCFGSYRRSWPGYSLGSHFCAVPFEVSARTWLDGWGARNTLAVAF